MYKRQKQIGVVSPLIVRPDPEGGFEILSGHRRLHAAQLAGLETVPVIVKEMDDDAAIIFMAVSYTHLDVYKRQGNGFLYNMVRIIAGTLIAVGMGQIRPGEMEQILEARERRRAGPTAPARGLTLIEMKYVD